MRRLAALCAFLLLLASTAGANYACAQPGWRGLVHYGYETTVWSVDDGLPQNSNQRVLRGSDGSIWMGGFGTPARFDGYAFRPAPLRGIPRGAVVYGDALMPCPGGGMCAVVRGHGVWRVQGDSLSQRLASFDVEGYGRDEYSDAIIVQTSQQTDASFYLVRADTTYRLGPYPPLGITRNGMAAMGRDGTLYSYSARGQTWKLQRGEWSLHSTQPLGFATSNLSGDSAGDVWTTGEAGIHRLTPSGLEPFSSLGWSRHILPYRDGYLAAGRDGVFRLSSDGAVLDTLATQHANWLYADESGAIWVALESDGVMRLRPHRIGTVDLGGFGTSGVRSIVRDRNGSLWTTGNCQGILNLTAQGERTIYGTSDENLSKEQSIYISSCLWTAAQTPDGTIWTTGIGGRLHAIRDGRIRLIDEIAGTSEFSLEGGSTVLFTDRSGTLWTSRRSDGRVFRRSRSSEFVAVPSLGLRDSTSDAEGTKAEAPNVSQFFEDAQGVLWIGGSGFVSRFDGEAFVTVLRVEGAARSFVQAADGTLYVGTYGGGIYRLDLDAQRRAQTGTLHASDVPRFRASDGLPDDFVSLLHLDDRGRLWSSHNQGLARTHLKALDTFWEGGPAPHTRIFTSADGLPSTEANGGFQGAGLVWPDGTLWLPTIKGVAVLAPDLADDAQPPPPPYLQLAEIDGVPVSCAAVGPCSLQLSPSDRRIRFRIGALTTGQSRSVDLDVRLWGGSGLWERVDPTDRSITYGGLRGGSYRLEGRARSVDGTWGEAHVLASLAVPTPLHQQLWFLIAAALALALGVAGFVHLRGRSLRAQAHVLQQAVDVQTDQLRVASARLEAQNAALSDLVESKERVMRMVSHDLKNPIGGIVGLADIVQSELAPGSEAHEMTGLIRGAGEQSLTLIHSILDAQHPETVPHLAELAPVDVRSIVTAAAALSRGFAHTKEQRIETAMPPRPLLVRADALRLRLVVDNLISNALKYAPRATAVRISADLDDAHAVLTVDDAGPGIPLGDRDRVFDPYTRLAAQPTGSETVTGLGLFLVREIVRQYGGSIWVDESPEGGARFAVRLPVVDHESGSPGT